MGQTASRSSRYSSICGDLGANSPATPCDAAADSASATWVPLEPVSSADEKQPADSEDGDPGDLPRHVQQGVVAIREQDDLPVLPLAGHARFLYVESTAALRRHADVLHVLLEQLHATHGTLVKTVVEGTGTLADLVAHCPLLTDVCRSFVAVVHPATCVADRDPEEESASAHSAAFAALSVEEQLAVHDSVFRRLYQRPKRPADITTLVVADHTGCVSRRPVPNMAHYVLCQRVRVSDLYHDALLLDLLPRLLCESAPTMELPSAWLPLPAWLLARLPVVMVVDTFIGSTVGRIYGTARLAATLEYAPSAGMAPRRMLADRVRTTYDQLDRDRVVRREEMAVRMAAEGVLALVERTAPACPPPDEWYYLYVHSVTAIREHAVYLRRMLRQRLRKTEGDRLSKPLRKVVLANPDVLWYLTMRCPDVATLCAHYVVVVPERWYTPVDGTYGRERERLLAARARAVCPVPPVRITTLQIGAAMECTGPHVRSHVVRLSERDDAVGDALDVLGDDVVEEGPSDTPERWVPVPHSVRAALPVHVINDCYTTGEEAERAWNGSEGTALHRLACAATTLTSDGPDRQEATRWLLDRVQQVDASASAC